MPVVFADSTGWLALKSTIDNFVKAGTITEHDALIGTKMAYVLTGGKRGNRIEPVDEQYLLDIEREVCVALAGEKKSQDRMGHMLKTGKPLRN